MRYNAKLFNFNFSRSFDETYLKQGEVHKNLIKIVQCTINRFDGEVTKMN